MSAVDDLGGPSDGGESGAAVSRAGRGEQYGVIDHVGRATLDGAEGWGLFEHATIGRHDPSGFADYLSVAP